MRGAIRNPDPAAVEAVEDEAIKLFIIGTAGVRQEADRDLFSELETSNAVGTEVHAGSIARHSDVCGKFVDLGPQGELLPAPRLQPHAVRTRLDRVCDDVALVEKCLEYPCAGARIHGVGGGIRWVSWAALRIGLRQQPRAKACLGALQPIAFQNSRI